MGNLKFEAALARLETLVSALEKGDLSLEASLKLFEEGVRLSKACTKLLNEAEKKVSFLMNDKNTALAGGTSPPPSMEDQSPSGENIESDFEEAPE